MLMRVYRKYVVVRMASCDGPDRQSHRAQVSVRSMNARYADRNSITCCSMCLSQRVKRASHMNVETHQFSIFQIPIL
jgi:hypothetical protein